MRINGEIDVSGARDVKFLRRVFQRWRFVVIRIDGDRNNSYGKMESVESGTVTSHLLFFLLLTFLLLDCSKFLLGKQLFQSPISNALKSPSRAFLMETGARYKEPVLQISFHLAPNS